jgi:hypothetical protein
MKGSEVNGFNIERIETYISKVSLAGIADRSQGHVEIDLDSVMNVT